MWGWPKNRLKPEWKPLSVIVGACFHTKPIPGWRREWTSEPGGGKVTVAELGDSDHVLLCFEWIRFHLPFLCWLSIMLYCIVMVDFSLSSVSLSSQLNSLIVKCVDFWEDMSVTSDDIAGGPQCVFKSFSNLGRPECVFTACVDGSSSNNDELLLHDHHHWSKVNLRFIEFESNCNT